MSSYRFITDSASDIPDEALAQYDITMLGIPMTIDGQSYREREDFTTQEFYQILRQAKELPVTSHITHLEFYEQYQKARQQGVEHIVVVTITSKGSNMYNAACMAKDYFFQENPQCRDTLTIDVIDSQAYTMVYGTAIIEAAKMARAGRPHEEIVDYLSHIPEHFDIYFTIFNLEYAKRSGRISFAAAFVGELLGLRPIMTLRDGQVTLTEKVRGDRAALTHLAELYATGAAATGKQGYFIVRGDNDLMAKELIEAIEAQTGHAPDAVYNIGACITLNAGPAVVGVTVPKPDCRQNTPL